MHHLFDILYKCVICILRPYYFVVFREYFNDNQVQML